MKYAAININVDSVSEEANFAWRGVDPAFTVASQRFLTLARHYRCPFSFFVVGKDLAHPTHRRTVRHWARLGHEIGNHSWSHHNNLGVLPPTVIDEEVEKTHDLIERVTGKKPVGFIAPGWSSSATLLQILERRGYTYDCSEFPSWVMVPALLKLFINRRHDTRKWKVFRRADLLTNLFGQTHPYRIGGLTELPLPVGRFRLPCYHTMGFIWGWERQRKLLDECLSRHESFYYLMHPIDLLDDRDLRSRIQIPLFERLAVPIQEKMRRADQMLQIIRQSGRRIVTMRELAWRAKRR